MPCLSARRWRAWSRTACGVGADGDHQVGGGHLHLGRQRPDVDVVHIDDTGDRGELALQRRDVEPSGGGLHQDLQRLTTQPPRTRQDEHADHCADHRVHPVPAGDTPDDRGHDHSEGPERVGDHLEVCATHVEALLRPGPQQQERDDVDQQTDHPDHEHRGGSDVGRITETADRLEQHVAGDREQQHRVDECGQDLEAVQPERALRMRSRGGGRLNGRQRHPEPERVGGHVAGVRQQRQRPGDDAGDDLNHQERDDQPERDQPAASCAAAPARKAAAP